MVPVPVRTLDEVIGVFDPRRLLEGETLTAYYAERGSILRRHLTYVDVILIMAMALFKTATDQRSIDRAQPKS
jgi:hypothetical protein